MRRFALAFAALLLCSVLPASAATIYVTAGHGGDLQAAMAAANSGDVVHMEDATYLLNSTLTIGAGITLQGQSQAGAVIDVNTGNSWGIHVDGSNVSLETFTANVITSTGVYQGYVIHASEEPVVTGFTGLTIQDVTVQGSGSGTVTKRRTGVDIHGFDNVTIDGVTSKDATWGNGFQITGCEHVTVDNSTTTNNAWGSLAVYVSEWFSPSRPCDDVVIDGATCSFGESNVFTEDIVGYASTNITVTGYEYYVRNTDFRAGAEYYTFFKDTYVDAVAAALAYTGDEDASSIEEIATGQFFTAPGMSIQAAIDAATPGDAVNVDAGTYVLPAQIVINKNLTLTGAGSALTLIEPGFNTGSGYVSAAALVYVDYGVTATIEGFAIDGSGWSVWDGIQSRGDHLTVRDCEIRDIYADTYMGRGILFLTGTGLVEDCTLSGIQRIGIHSRGNVEFPAPVVAVDNLNYTGKGAGDWLDYGVEFGGGGGGSVINSTINACTGVASTDGSTSAGILVTDYWGTGTVADIDDSDLSGNTTGVAVGYDVSDASTATITGCDLSGSTSHGVSSTGVSVDAIGNWWGHASGPFHATTNAGGLGVPVSDNVLFDPYSGMATIGITPLAAGPINCSESSTHSFGYTPDPMSPALRGYTIRVTASAEVSFTLADIVINTGLVPDSEMTQIIDNGTNDFTIDYAIMGATAGITTAVNFFDVTFHGVGDGIATVSFVDCILRDVTNFPIGSDFSATAAIDVDCSAPALATVLTADPAHEEVVLTWTDPVDGDLDGIEVWRATWHDGALNSIYPEYDDVSNTIPTRPADQAAALASAEWTLAGTAAPGDNGFTDSILPRGVYYYEVFPVDDAGNCGAPATQVVRATNYWLGDISDGTCLQYDGYLLSADLTCLGTAYGTADGHASYEAEIDVGPTDDFSGTGIPQTDNLIGFEDLMIFAMNYDLVAPMPVAQGSEIAQLSWLEMDEGHWALGLSEPCANLKALHLRAELPEGAEIVLTGASLLDQQAGPVFLHQIDGQGMDISLAMMGRDAVISGQGLLFTVRLPEGTMPGRIELELRDAANAELPFELTATEVSDLPTAYKMSKNFPNPFNPKTSISFELPETQFVKLTVFAADGRRVTTLLNEQVAAGRHVTVWEGRDEDGRPVASGVYFARIKAGPLAETHKMLLMK